jgi:hypothetical protein
MRGSFLGGRSGAGWTGVGCPRLAGGRRSWRRWRQGCSGLWVLTATEREGNGFGTARWSY